VSRRDPAALFAKARRANREKKRRQRERWAAGESVYRVTLNVVDLEAALAEAGFLDANTDKHADVEAALQKMIVALLINGRSQC